MWMPVIAGSDQRSVVDAGLIWKLKLRAAARRRGKLLTTSS